MRARAGFSVGVLMIGITVNNISPLQITRSVSGMGTSGISISCLTFSAPIDDIIETEKRRAPAVVVTGIDGLNTQWWVDKRTVKNGIMTFTCYDTLAFADSTYFTEDDFEQTVLESIGSINTVAVLDIIKRKLERGNPLEINSGGSASYCKFTADALIGQTVSSALSTIADCACGYWCVDNSNTIRLVRYDGYNGGSISAGNDYTAPDIGMPIDVSGINASLDSGEMYNYRSGNAEMGYIFDVNTHGTMTKEDVDDLGIVVCGENKYRNGSVEKIITQNVPELGCNFQGFVINNVTANIDRSGIICSISANEVSGGEIGQYMGEITRQLNNTVQQGVVMGKNVMMTAYQGIMFVEGDDGSGK